MLCSRYLSDGLDGIIEVVVEEVEDVLFLAGRFVIAVASRPLLPANLTSSGAVADVHRRRDKPALTREGAPSDSPSSAFHFRPQDDTCTHTRAIPKVYFTASLHWSTCIPIGLKTDSAILRTYLTGHSKERRVHAPLQHLQCKCCSPCYGVRATPAESLPNDGGPSPTMSAQGSSPLVNIELNLYPGSVDVLMVIVRS